MSFAVTDAQLRTNQVFLRLGPAGGPKANLELLEPCEVVIKAARTNDIIRLAFTNSSRQLSNLRHTEEGTLEVEVTMHGSRHFVLTANQLTVEEVRRNPKPKTMKLNNKTAVHRAFWAALALIVEAI
jgi:hypothetical protein